MSLNPYLGISKERFWKNGVTHSDFKVMPKIHTPKWSIENQDTIVTMGSCFAQHIANWLRKNGSNVPFYDVDTNIKSKNFSANYGNIYTVKQALQLVEEVSGKRKSSESYWKCGDGYIDPLRPNVLQTPVAVKENIAELRESHLQCVKKSLVELDILVFTLGLTEAWRLTECKTVLPSAPGVIGGEFDPDRYEFINFGYPEVMEDLEALHNAILNLRNGKSFRLLLTVSPVPLTATAEEQHVLLSSTYSKSVLRAVAGDFVKENIFADYFPSFEIINNPAAKSEFFEDNFRSVKESSVKTVMSAFSDAYFSKKGSIDVSSRDEPSVCIQGEGDVDCEDALLDGFSDLDEPGMKLQQSNILTIGDSHLASVRKRMKKTNIDHRMSFVPWNFLKNKPFEEIETNKFKKFQFDDNYPRFTDINLEEPNSLVITGWQLFGDAILRAHGPIRSGFPGCVGAEISPDLRRIEVIDDELIDINMKSIKKRLSFVKIIENECDFENIYWMASPDLPEKVAKFRFGSDFVNGGHYNLYKESYRMAFDLVKSELYKTTYLFHPYEELCAESGFTRDKYANDSTAWDIHCNDEYYTHSVEELSKLVA